MDRSAIRDAARRMLGVAALVGLAALTGCDTVSEPAQHFGVKSWTRERQVVGGDPERGRQLIGTYGCGSCHVIPGVPGARGRVGPPLEGMAQRVFIAGQLTNVPENMVRWIENPQAVEPGTAMPDLGVSSGEARDIAAYLYTLK